MKNNFGIGVKAFAAAIAFGAIAMSGNIAANADELRIAVGMTGNNGLVEGMRKFADNIEKNTGGEYTGKIFPNTLLNFAESMNGVREGIADVAYVVPAYHRAEFPNSNLVVDVATLSTNPVVMAGAANEFMMNCADCLKEYAVQNQVFLGFSVIGPYYLMSKDKVSSLEDFKGKKFRGFGPFGRWVEAMGASPIVLSANDIYESISQGQLDGNTHIVDTLKSLSIGEVVDYLLEAPIGLYIGNSMFNLNKDVWNELSDEQKRQFLLAAGDAHGFTTVTYLAENQAYLNDPASVGVEIIQPEADVVAATKKFHEDDLGIVAELNATKYGIANAAEQIDQLRALVKKWEGLVAGIDQADPAAVGALYNQQIFSKIDTKTLD